VTCAGRSMGVSVGSLHFLQQPSVTLPVTLRVEVADTWTAWIQAGAAAFTAAGLIAAGFWALFRFRRGRTFMPRCSIELGCAATSIRGKTALQVNVTVRNCGDSRVRFQPTDISRIEVSSVTIEEWCRLKDGRCVEWKGEDWRMREDLLAVGQERLQPVDLEPGQDLGRSCLFLMPIQWAAARVRCVLTLGEDPDKREWLATQVITRSNLNDGAHRAPIVRASLERQ
jgi:hypothetical protein